MNSSSTQFDEVLDKIEHFRRFPVMKPFVGKNYASREEKRIMLIGESHYLPEGSVASIDAEKWYKPNQLDLKQAEFDWINTRRILSSEWSADGHMIFRELEKRMSAFYDTSLSRAMTNVVFMNGFQRPAPEKGTSIRRFSREIDYEVSARTIEAVIDIVKPNLILFVSKFSWDKLGRRLSINAKDRKLEFTCHPGTGGRYWHKVSYSHGIEKFKRLVAAYS